MLYAIIAIYCAVNKTGKCFVNIAIYTNFAPDW